MFLFEGMHLKTSTLIVVLTIVPFRGPILVPRWSGAVHMLPTSVVGGSKPRPCAFYLVPDSCTISAVEWRRIDCTGDVQEAEG